jgi:hypothetical protein
MLLLGDAAVCPAVINLPAKQEFPFFQRGSLRTAGYCDLSRGKSDAGFSQPLAHALRKTKFCRARKRGPCAAGKEIGLSDRPALSRSSDIQALSRAPTMP